MQTAEREVDSVACKNDWFLAIAAYFTISSQIKQSTLHTRIQTNSAQFVAHDNNSIYTKHAICYHPSVCLSRVDQSKTVEVRIMKFKPYCSPIPLVYAGQVSSKRHQTRQGWGKQAII